MAMFRLRPTPQAVADVRPPAGSESRETNGSMGALRDPWLLSAMPTASKNVGKPKAGGEGQKKLEE